MAASFRALLACALLLSTAGGLHLARAWAQSASEPSLPTDSFFKPGRLQRGPDGRIYLETQTGIDERRVCPPGSQSEACDHHSVAEALGAARFGEIVTIASGVYREGAVLRADGVTIRAEPGAHMQGVAVRGKAALVIQGNDTVIEGLECSGIAVRDGNGACIRLEGRNLTLRGVHFRDSQQGLLGGKGTILIEDSRFERLGYGGQAHGVYVLGEELIIRRTQFLSSKGQGHEIKSRTARTIIERSVVASLDGDDSRLIDISNGGEVVIRGNVLEIGPRSVNYEMIGIGYEGLKHERNEAVIEDNLIIKDHPNAILYGGPVAAVIRDNVIVGGQRRENNRWFPDRAQAGLPPYPYLPAPEDRRP